MDIRHFSTSSIEAQAVATVNPETGYIENIDDIREAEYPNLADTTYLDHAGTTLYAKSLIETYSKKLTENLFGNPHSASTSSQLSSRQVDDVRLQVLQFFQANPDHFDVVFVGNATAAIKFVGDAFRDHDNGFRYYYHGEAHTSMVGVRELASRGSICHASDCEVETWIHGLEHGHVVDGGDLSLFAYPAQSNMTGRRLPLRWCQRIQDARRTFGHPVFTLLDAAALVSTAPLDLSDNSAAPDFTALSFYKIFGFPDLGALIVRKDSGDVLRRRKYFGGGTVDMVTMYGDAGHAKKESSLHSCLEDGTLPFHSIVALQSALDVHRRLYGSTMNVSRHANFLASNLRKQLQRLRHGNGNQVCLIYTEDVSPASSQGPVIAFNLKDKLGHYVSNSEVEKLGIVKSIQFRTGGVCNPGGVASHLGLSVDEMLQNYAAGQRCGGENDILNGKPTGVIRVSVGAMSNMNDVATFANFIREFYVDSSPLEPLPMYTTAPIPTRSPSSFVVESLSVFPVKSCAAYQIPSNISWPVGLKGLAWDREWCLVHQGTNAALSQKRFPRMALIRPEIDLQKNVLRLTFDGDLSRSRSLEVSLDSKPTRTRSIHTCDATNNKTSSVCGEDVDVDVYTSPEVADFFTEALGVPCTLARCPNAGTIRQAKVRVPASNRRKQATETGRSMALSNESPILLISRSSVNRLNEQIKHNSGVGKAVAADSFRGNIVIAEELDRGQTESPYAEDDWTSIQIGDEPHHTFELLGPCQRCQMVCVDQKNAQRRQEPFSTLAKTRRRDGRVWFGMHMCLLLKRDSVDGESLPGVRIQVGDRITPGVTR
ncbi:uncharacterized protein Z518_10494 [Rhinocladiella mackenziei CBS 650.93]|uniref:Molybdenum cofactor sulfurase n=1 Tax=Rhinocladiella mackenziei CBS 650.93 TaxID=1442369 RepID=A0A0D2IUF3_9EURO|nr:uncharacterized protein Z518_10494 [Rhinocladiella mackenziei CBS 650.93]KIX00355.1 hypothetical protein Z518_10494 [Rhinocladiella mackenziei CBS 650.93]